jgi:hypothetical protein
VVRRCTAGAWDASPGPAAGKRAPTVSFECLWSSYSGRTVNALAPGVDEGRGQLRKASVSRKQALTRRSPNGATHSGSSLSIVI